MQKESGDRCSEITRKIARAGTFGRHANNTERDICRSLGLPLVSGFNRISTLYIFVIYYIYMISKNIYISII